VCFTHIFLATGWTTGVQGFDSRRGLGIFLFTTASRKALGPTQPPIQWVPGPLSVGIKRPEREADHSSPSSAEVKEWVELYLHSPNTPSWRGAQLKHRYNFTFYPYLSCYSVHCLCMSLDQSHAARQYHFVCGWCHTTSMTLIIVLVWRLVMTEAL
jgi:hypothetical protein